MDNQEEKPVTVMEAALLEKNSKSMSIRQSEFTQTSGNGSIDGEAMADIMTSHPRQGYAKINDAREKVEAAKELLYKAKLALLEESDELNKSYEAAEARIKKTSSKVKDYAEQMKNQLTRINTILGNDFESRIQQMERFVVCLERLNELGSPKVKEILEILQKR